MRVADVGAGTGYFALPMARAVSPGDDREAVLVEAARILGPEGRIAILDWRTDVQVPPGPPLEHRVAASDVRAALRARRWKVGTPEPVGLFS